MDTEGDTTCISDNHVVASPNETPMKQPWHWEDFPETKIGTLEERLKGISTHLSLWPGARSLLRWLEARQTSLGLNLPGLRIIELGSGVGWFGLNLSANLEHAAPLVLTDRAEAVQSLKDNCGRFKSHKGTNNFCVEQMDWREWQTPHDSTPTLPTGGPFDLILGSDLCWNSETTSSLPWAVKALLEDGKAKNRDTRVLYGHWHRSPKVMPIFMEACAVAGILVAPCVVEPDSGYEDRHAPKSNASSLPSESIRQDKLSEDSDDDVDWLAEIFHDPDAKEEAPIFVVYSLALQTP